MTLKDLHIPIEYENAKLLGLVFSKEISDILYDKHQQYGNPLHCPLPIALNNGKFALCGDILTEVMPNGLYYSWFNSLERDIIDQIHILSWDSVIDMMHREEPPLTT